MEPCWDAAGTEHGCWHWWEISWCPHCLVKHELGTLKGCFEDLRQLGSLALVADPWEIVVEVEEAVDGAEEGDEDGFEVWEGAGGEKVVEAGH